MLQLNSQIFHSFCFVDFVAIINLKITYHLGQVENHCWEKRLRKNWTPDCPWSYYAGVSCSCARNSAWQNQIPADWTLWTLQNHADSSFLKGFCAGIGHPQVWKLGHMLFVNHVHRIHIPGPNLAHRPIKLLQFSLCCDYLNACIVYTAHTSLKFCIQIKHSSKKHSQKSKVIVEKPA